MSDVSHVSTGILPVKCCSIEVAYGYNETFYAAAAGYLRANAAKRQNAQKLRCKFMHFLFKYHLDSRAEVCYNSSVNNSTFYRTRIGRNKRLMK